MFTIEKADFAHRVAMAMACKPKVTYLLKWMTILEKDDKPKN